MDSIVQSILEQHQLWLFDSNTGTQANLRKHNLSNLNLSAYRLSCADLSHTTLNNTIIPRDCTRTWFVYASGAANFDGVDISSSNFEKANINELSLIGAKWHGTRITECSDWIIKFSYHWVFCTNAFVQIGCTQNTWEDWQDILSSKESLQKYIPNVNLDVSWEWWNANKQIIEEWHNSRKKTP